MIKKLIQIQSELKVPKAQTNSHGGYKFRSCEDILESVKPILKKYDCCIIMKDEIVSEGNRIYVRATAQLLSADGGKIETTAFAREPENRKGFDESQLTGAASSYARKYALNALFGIDDTKDADATNRHETTEPEKGNIESIREQIIMCDSLKSINALSEQAGKMQWTKEERAELKQMFESKRSELK